MARGHLRLQLIGTESHMDTNQPAKPGFDRSADIARPIERQAERDESQPGSCQIHNDGAARDEPPPQERTDRSPDR